MAGGTKRYIRDSDNESMRDYEHGGEVKSDQEFRDQIFTSGEFVKKMYKSGGGPEHAGFDRVIGNMHKMDRVWNEATGTFDPVHPVHKATTQSGVSIRDPNHSWKYRNFHTDITKKPQPK